MGDLVGNAGPTTRMLWGRRGKEEDRDMVWQRVGLHEVELGSVICKQTEAHRVNSSDYFQRCSDLPSLLVDLRAARCQNCHSSKPAALSLFSEQRTQSSRFSFSASTDLKIPTDGARRGSKQL